MIVNHENRLKYKIMTIYNSLDCLIETERIDVSEAKVIVNDQTLIYISRQDELRFKDELTRLLDKYRI